MDRLLALLCLCVHATGGGAPWPPGRGLGAAGLCRPRAGVLSRIGPPLMDPPVGRDAAAPTAHPAAALTAARCGVDTPPAAVSCPATERRHPDSSQS